MSTFDDVELKMLLSCLGTPEPSARLVRDTKDIMHRELASLVAAPAAGTSWIVVLAGLAVMMSLCLFYMLTVGTILQLVAPAWMIYYLQKSLLVFTAMGGTVIAGTVLAMILKYMPTRYHADGMRLAYNMLSHNHIPHP